MRKYILILGLLVVVSCKKVDAEVSAGFAMRYESPQPINDAELSKIPNKFRGLFMDSDSGYVNVKENIILKERYYKVRFHKNGLDSIKSAFDLVGNRYVSKINNDVFDYRYVGDSIELAHKEVDTFFVFSKAQKAKRVNGQLILNYKDSVFWKIKVMSLDKNVLKIKDIYSEEDLNRMDSLTQIKSARIDSSLFILKPSRSEFKRVINLKKFGEDKDYIKVK